VWNVKRRSSLRWSWWEGTHMCWGNEVSLFCSIACSYYRRRYVFIVYEFCMIGSCWWHWIIRFRDDIDSINWNSTGSTLFVFNEQWFQNLQKIINVKTKTILVFPKELQFQTLFSSMTSLTLRSRWFMMLFALLSSSSRVASLLE